MTPRQLVVELARSVRAAVRPQLGRLREVTGRTESGDASFALDDVAEDAVTAYLGDAGVSVARFTEDRGLLGPTDAEWLLVVDPIDGTRPAKAGLECCCVSVALAPNRPDATMGDVTHAAVYELKADRLFVAVRGEGVTIHTPGDRLTPAPSTRTDLHGAALSVEWTGRPVVPTARVLEHVIDGGSLLGGLFCFASSTFAITRLVLGQLDLHCDVADRLRRELPRLEPKVLAAGNGRPIALFVYDLAAVALIAAEAGVVMTDAYGHSLDSVPLTDVSLPWHRSCLAAANPDLHRQLLAAVDEGVARLTAEFNAPA